MAATQDFYDEINEILNTMIQVRDRQRMLDDIEADGGVSQTAIDEIQTDIDTRLTDAKSRAANVVKDFVRPDRSE